MLIHTVLGAGGAVADALTRELLLRQLPVRLVSRNPIARADTTTMAADLTDPEQTLKAVTGSAVVYLCVGLKYNFTIWRRDWPRIISNTIEACRQTQTKLIFFDNVYMYGRTQGAMTEDTSYEPLSKKGDLRARLATQIMSEVRHGNITAIIARSADFYGPGTGKTSIPDVLIFQRLLKGQKPQWPINASVPHSLTYVPDAARALALLSTDPNSWNQVWHLPTAAPAVTAEQFIAAAAHVLGKKASLQILPAWMIQLGGLFDRTTAELYEMLYQYAYDYQFDSSKFEKAYHFTPTSYEEGIRTTALAHMSGASPL